MEGEWKIYSVEQGMFRLERRKKFTKSLRTSGQRAGHRTSQYPRRSCHSEEKEIFYFWNIAAVHRLLELSECKLSL